MMSPHRLHKMTWAEIPKFLMGDAAVLGALAVFAAIAGAAVAAFRAPFRRWFRKQETNVDTIVQKLRETARQEGVPGARLEDAHRNIEDLGDQNRQLTEAVQALAAAGANPKAPPGIREALKLLAEGMTEAAETVFEEIKRRRKAEGEDALEDAAAAARHVGALAFWHGTDKALAAYREAVALDPDDPDGWNQLGHLFRRTGDLDGATEAYNRVLSLGIAVEDQQLIAVATGNFGNIHLTRGDLDRAGEMYRRSLDLNEAFGHKEGMAVAAGNLGIFYNTQGDLDRAEEMYRKSLDLNEALGRKEGMASQYGSLGSLYESWGDLDRAEEMYRKSLDLFREIGAVPKIEQAEGLLAELLEVKESPNSAN